ncbi:unnamed protein product [Amoebophrya sp. A25]|nr:unnamed protein product [Amoebophrya sp. A25]|eukprot:GSA25T00011276001.1
MSCCVPIRSSSKAASRFLLVRNRQTSRVCGHDAASTMRLYSTGPGKGGGPIKPTSKESAPSSIPASSGSGAVARADGNKDTGGGAASSSSGEDAPKTSGGAEGSASSPLTALSYVANIAFVAGLGYIGKQAYDSQQEASKLTKMHEDAQARAKKSFDEQQKLEKALAASEDGINSVRHKLAKEAQLRQGAERALSQTQEELANAQGTLARLLPPDEAHMTAEQKAAVRQRRAQIKDAQEILEGAVQSVLAGPTEKVRVQLEQARKKYVELAGTPEDGQQFPILVDPRHLETTLRRVDAVLADSEKQVAAVGKLDAAITKRDKDAMRAALGECRVLEVNPGAAKFFAELLLEPEKLLKQLAEDKKIELGALQDFNIADFVEAERALVAGGPDVDGSERTPLSREALEKRLLSRTQQLAENRRYFAARLADELQNFSEKIEAHAVEKVQQAKTRFQADAAKEFEGIKKGVEMEERERYEKMVSQAIGAVTEKLDEETKQKLATQKGQSVGELLQVRSAHSAALSELAGDIDALATVVNEDSEEIDRLKSQRKLHRLLNAATMMFDEKRAPLSEALLPLQTQTVDPVTNQMARAPGAKGGGTLLRSGLDVTRAFDNTLRSWVVACFVESPTNFWSHLYANVVGRFYHVSRGIISNGAGDEDRVDKALACLNAAAHYVDQGDLRNAIWVIDAMPTGFARDRVEPWVVEARAALVGENLFKALKARLQCLNAIHQTG